MKDDEILMAEEIGRLRTLNDTLKHELSDYHYRVYVSWAAFAFLILPFAAIIGTLGLRAVLSNGETSHCYIDTPGMDGMLHLYGNIDGLKDTDLGGFRSALDAIKEAQAIGCPMWRRK